MGSRKASQWPMAYVGVPLNAERLPVPLEALRASRSEGRKVCRGELLSGGAESLHVSRGDTGLL